MKKYIIFGVILLLMPITISATEECPLSLKTLICGEWDYTNGSKSTDPLHISKGNQTIQINDAPDLLVIMMAAIMIKILTDIEMNKEKLIEDGEGK